MIEKPKRPILHLKAPPPVSPEKLAAEREWKCGPCGKPFRVTTDMADEDPVRCPACNARLGLTKDFRGETPNLARLRARVVAGR
jgi:DNA-directed RNA polymerase subunit RPC12/RpoP